MGEKKFKILIGLIVVLTMVFFIQLKNTNVTENVINYSLDEISFDIMNEIDGKMGIRIIDEDTINNYYMITQVIKIPNGNNIDITESKCKHVMNGLRVSGYYKIPNKGMLYTYKSEYEIFFNVHYDYVAITMTNFLSYK